MKERQQLLRSQMLNPQPSRTLRCEELAKSAGLIEKTIDGSKADRLSDGGPQLIRLLGSKVLHQADTLVVIEREGAKAYLVEKAEFVSEGSTGDHDRDRDNRAALSLPGIANGYTVLRMANRNSKRRAKSELKSRRQSGQKLVNPESKRAGARRGMAPRGRRNAPMAA